MEIEGTVNRSSQSGRYSHLEVLQHSNCLLVFCILAGFLCFAVCLAVGMAANWKLAGFLLYVFLLFLVGGLICLAVVGWQVRLMLLEHDRKVNEVKLLNRGAALYSRALAIADRADRQQDNIKLRVDDKGLTLEVVRSAMAARQPAAGRVSVAPAAKAAALPAPGRGVAQQQEVIEEEAMLPVAPRFGAMAHLITSARMPLCFVADKASGQVIPMFGTIDDLLSMAVTGKPGRGKTVALMYYVAMLLKCGAEVYVFDPHGAMAELAVLNDRVLPGMPATAKIHYFDRKETITGAIPGLYRELEDRDNYYRPQYVNGELVSRRVKHPLLVLADELPILADFDEQVAIEYKRINRQRLKDGDEELEVPSLIYLIRRIVLEARKWRCFFIGSGQSMDAEVLPTKVTENLNSRIVFFSSNRRARMSGLENDAIKNLLPQIRRGGSGVMVYDCARWDEPLIGAIPYTTIDDLLDFLGVDLSDGATLGMFGAGSASEMSEHLALPEVPTKKISEKSLNGVSKHNTGALENAVNPLVEQSGSVPDVSPLGPEDMQFNNEQIVEFIKLFKALGNRKECLRRMRNPRSASGYGLSNRYDKHAKLIVEQYRLEQK